MSAATRSDRDDALDCDSVVIGGGPAGLTGAIYLARFRRSVRLVDAGHGRAVRIPRSHNVPGYPQGVVGAELVAAMRAQAARYGAQLDDGRVQRLQRLDDGGFAVHFEDGRALRCRTVLLATGVSDVEPEMPELAQALHDGALRYCPVCDGFEVIGQSVGVLADSAKGVREALYLHHFSDRVTLFLTRRVSLDEDDRDQLARAGISLQEAPVRGLRLLDDSRVRIEHGAGADTCNAVYGALGLRVHSGLATALGAECDEDGYLLTDRHQRTSVPGLYAAGDVVKSLNQITVAAGGAASAASAMHLDMGAHG